MLTYFINITIFILFPLMWALVVSNLNLEAKGFKFEIPKQLYNFKNNTGESEKLHQRNSKNAIEFAALRNKIKEGK